MFKTFTHTSTVFQSITHKPSVHAKCIQAPGWDVGLAKHVAAAIPLCVQGLGLDFHNEKQLSWGAGPT